MCRIKSLCILDCTSEKDGLSLKFKKHHVVNLLNLGKFSPFSNIRITNGHFSDYFMTGVRTSKSGLSMLLIPRSEGVETKIIKTSYSHAAGTAYVSFDKVLVPVKYLMGTEGNGLKVILSSKHLSSSSPLTISFLSH